MVQNGYKNEHIRVKKRGNKPKKENLARGAITATDEDERTTRWPDATDGTSRPHLVNAYRFNDEGKKTSRVMKHTDDEKETIRFTMNKVSNEIMNGCMEFVDDTALEEHYTFIEIFNKDECSADLGWVYPRYQNEMNLSPEGTDEGGPSCLDAHTIQHEWMHALGFEHEQTRPDRDDYITIDTDFIDDDMLSQYEKLPDITWMDTNSPFDVFSVMLYSGYGYQKGEHPMTSKLTGEPVAKPFRPRMSSEDAFQLAAMYSNFCPALPSRTCDNGDRYLGNFAW